MKQLLKRCFTFALTLSAVCFFVLPVIAHPGSGIVADHLGQIYFLDTGSGLWKIDTRGGISHLSPLRNHWLATDEKDGFTQPRLPTDTGRDWVITAAGSNPTLLISTDFPLVIGADGKLYYPSVREKNVRILRASPQGSVTTFITLPRSVAGADIGWINGVATGPAGSLYYTENNAVRLIDAQGKVSTLATVTSLTNRPATPGSESRPYLRGLKVDARGTVYVADAADARVLKITPDGKIQTILQLENPWAPTDVALFGDTVYVLEFLHTAGDDRTEWMPRIRKITPAGNSTIILSVDQMPGARPAKTPSASSSQVASNAYLHELLWSVFYFFTPKFA